jgi:DHA3 family macrolide efflux protein-like MFS transporter
VKGLFADRNFRSLWLGSNLSAFGDWFVLVALNLWVYSVHRQGIDISLLVLSQLIPAFLLGPMLGSWVDRLNQKRATMIASDVLRALLCLALLVAHSLLQVYVVAFFMALLTSVFTPAAGALFQSSVANVPLSVRFNQFTYYGMSIFAPAAAGLVIGSFGYSSCFVVDSASFLVSALCSFFVRPVVGSVSEAEEQERKQGWRHGLRYVLRGNPLIGIVVLGAGMIMLGGGATSIAVVIFTQSSLGLGSGGYGFFLASYSVGMLMGSLFVILRSGHMKVPFVYAWGIIICGLFAMMTALSPIGIVCLGLWGVSGFGSALFNTERRTILQTYTPSAYIGFVLNLNNSCYTAGYLLSSLVAGLLVTAPTVRIFLLLANVILVVVGAWSLWSVKRLA